MPGRLILTRSTEEIAAALPDRGDIPPQTPRRNIAPGQEVLALTPGGWATARWGMIPVGRTNARGRPVMDTIVNARSETVFDKSAYEGVGRAVVPADGWYEWTGKARRKTPWRITRGDGGLMFFAAITDVWTAPGGREVLQIATVTCAPSADVVEIHDRMGVILTAEQVPTWLGPDQQAAAALMQPLAAGTLKVEEARDVDWSAP